MTKPVRGRTGCRGRCSRCGRLVVVGELIASIGGGPFICVSHLTRKDTGNGGEDPAA